MIETHDNLEHVILEDLPPSESLAITNDEALEVIQAYFAKRDEWPTLDHGREFDVTIVTLDDGSKWVVKTSKTMNSAVIRSYMFQQMLDVVGFKNYAPIKAIKTINEPILTDSGRPGATSRPGATKSSETYLIQRFVPDYQPPIASDLQTELVNDMREKFGVILSDPRGNIRNISENPSHNSLVLIDFGGLDFIDTAKIPNEKKQAILQELQTTIPTFDVGHIQENTAPTEQTSSIDSVGLPIPTVSTKPLSKDDLW